MAVYGRRSIRRFGVGLCLAAALSLPTSATAIALIGDGLNRPASWFGYFGRVGAGEVSAKGIASDVVATMAGGYVEGALWAACLKWVDCVAAPVYRSKQRIPVFAYGLLGKATGSGTTWMLASLWQPDQVKRSGNPGKHRVKIKQNAYVLFGNVGTFMSSAFSQYIGGVAGCKGLADIRTNVAKGERTAKIKVSCRKGALEERFGPVGAMRIEDLLLEFGLKKPSIQWQGRETLP
jgi:hypothetical protein